MESSKEASPPLTTRAEAELRFGQFNSSVMLASALWRTIPILESEKTLGLWYEKLGTPPITF